MLLPQLHVGIVGMHHHVWLSIRTLTITNSVIVGVPAWELASFHNKNLATRDMA